MNKPLASQKAIQGAGVVTGKFTHQDRARLVALLDEHLGRYGGKRDESGVWRAIGSIGVKSGRAPLHPSAATEGGWNRWSLPGRDGVTRGRLIDRAAPWVELSPSGVIFLHRGKGKGRRYEELERLMGTVAGMALKGWQ